MTKNKQMRTFGRYLIDISISLKLSRRVLTSAVSFSLNVSLAQIRAAHKQDSDGGESFNVRKNL